MKAVKLFVTACLAFFFAAFAHGSVVYNAWTSNEAPNGNYTVTFTENSGDIEVLLTVIPWNAEALGLFVDLGDLDIVGDVSLASVIPSGKVALYATDTSSNTCGNGCNLNGLNPSIPADGEWELVFRLGQQGFDGIQNFSFTIDVADLDLTEGMLGMVGIRAQQLCSGSNALPGGSCPGSDKVYASAGTPKTPIVPGGEGGTTSVPEPASLALAAAGLLGLAVARRRRTA